MDINSLPRVSAAQMEAMEKAAAQKMQQEGYQEPVVQEEPQVDIPIEENVSEQPQVQEVKPQRKTPEQSFSELREKADRMARERDEYAQRLYEYERTLKQTQQPQEQTEPDLNINPDDLVEGKHLKSVYKEVNQLKKQLDQSRREAMLANAEARIKSQYHDFDKVVSQDNLKLLAYTYPELAHTINSSNDLYNQAVSAYMMIKQTGIYKEQSYDMEKRRAQENAMKPRLSPAGNAIDSESALSKAHALSGDLTPELKKQLMKEMVESRGKTW